MVRRHAIVPKFGKRVTDVLKSMLRPALIPAEGKRFVVADWSSIEARVTPWCSGDSGEEKLDLFRKGEDVYCYNAAATFKVPYQSILDGHRAKDRSCSDMRQIGKVQELACAFGGSVGAFAAMGRAYNIHLPENEARRMVEGWRKANTWAVPYWSDLELGYTSAIRDPRKRKVAGRVTYYFDGVHLWYLLPSGRALCYPHARIEEDGVTYAKASWKPAADAKQWPRARLWKGLACENITQAVAADILRYALREIQDVVLHVHDEIVVETDRPDDVLEHMQRVMSTPPVWAKGLPLAAEASIMDRYGKG